LPQVALNFELPRRLPALTLAVTVALFLGVSVQLETGFGGGWASDLFTNWLYDGVGLCAAATCFLRALRGTERSAWVLIGLGVLLWTLGDIYYTAVLQNAVSQPYPSLADAGYLGLYVPVFIALALLIRARVVQFARSLWLDGLIAGFTVCSLATGIVLDEVWRTSTGSLAAVATNLAYPAGDALLLALVIAAFGLAGWSLERTWLLLGGGFAVFALVDSLYLFEVAKGTYHYGSWMDLGWPAGFVLIASASCVSPGSIRRARFEGVGVLAVPIVMALGCLTIVVWDHFHRVNLVSLITAALGLLAVVGRLALTFKEHHTLLQATRQESLTDALTGLQNRRALMRRLEDVLSEQPTPPRLLLLFDLDGFKAYNDTFGHAAGDSLLRRLGDRLDRSVGVRGDVFRLGGDEFCILVEGGAVELEWVRAVAAASLRESGTAFTITCSSGHTLIPDEAENPNDALQIADRRMYAEKSVGSDGRALLVHTFAGRENYAARDSSDLATYSAALAAEVGLRGADAKLVRAAAELHDVGKLALPETLLAKPGTLDEAEWKLVRQHTLIGERIIAAAEGLENVAQTVRSTHERWDGAGYPDGLSRDAIPLASRLIAVCDAYDAMITERPYRAARSQEDAVRELRRSAGTQFDPYLVDVFIRRVLPATGAGMPTAVSDGPSIATG
jgi:diguanylate cyclase (GGDEF)-like protein